MLTTVVIPAPVAKRNQITPLQRYIRHGNQELPPPHLLPEEAYETKQASDAAAQTEQTNKHGDNQGDVNADHDSDGNFIALHSGRRAAACLR